MAPFRIPAPQYRSLPPPSGLTKMGLFYAQASAIPPDLWDWRDVNPREVKERSAVWNAIYSTLTQEPERFFERNRGLTISAEEVEYDDKRKQVVVTLSDKKIHGLVDGGHTLSAILRVQENPPESGWPADVFVKVITGVDPGQIAEIAGGLNRSEQVDLTSLENLKGHFGQLQALLSKEKYRDLIAYKMNEDKPIDVREVLYYLAVFDCDAYGENKHPTLLFGRKEGIVRKFAEQAAKDGESGDSFKILISRAADILKLRDLIERKVAEENVGRFKAGPKDRIKSKKFKGNKLYFLDETIDAKVPLGWIMPMLGGFRANVIWNQPEGSFSWKIRNERLLDTCVEKLLSCIKEIHESENRRPEHVGRNATAWRLCFETVQNAILQNELAQMKA